MPHISCALAQPKHARVTPGKTALGCARRDRDRFQIRTTKLGRHFVFFSGSGESGGRAGFH
ncbi:hypothetical protein WI23_28245 [Burkholderia oklahomensis C6786]|nr:hypothetical protein WI23_28245 [Burkholderia oklahomensis C6786]KUY55658.1 hypothetical protein WI23_20590 [Burkholderia oklahomensis C6786]